MSYSLDLEMTPVLTPPLSVPIQISVYSELDCINLVQTYWTKTGTTLTFDTETYLKVKALVSAVYQTGILGDPTNPLTSVGYAFKDWNSGTPPVSTSNPLIIDVSGVLTYTADYLETPYYDVRKPSLRSAKYYAKTDEQVAQMRVIALKPMMVEQQNTTAPEQALLETQTNNIIHPLGISGIFIHHYHNFANELYSLKKRFTSASLITESNLIAEKWATRGLDPTVLTNIAQIMGIAITVSEPTPPPPPPSVITRVQGNKRGTGTGATAALTLDQPPVEGNLLILTTSLNPGDQGTWSITETGVTWTLSELGYGYGRHAEIWSGLVGSSPSPDMTLTFSESVTYVVNVCEYSGLLTTGFLDQVAWNSGGYAYPYTGATSETSQASELWIATISVYAQDITTPINDFTLLDGVNYSSSITNAYLEKIVSEIGVAGCTCTNTGGENNFAAAIATFKGA